MESVVAVISGWLVLHEAFTFKELAGCALMFAAIILAQAPPAVKGPALVLKGRQEGIKSALSLDIFYRSGYHIISAFSGSLSV